MKTSKIYCLSKFQIHSAALVKPHFLKPASALGFVLWVRVCRGLILRMVSQRYPAGLASSSAAQSERTPPLLGHLQKLPQPAPVACRGLRLSLENSSGCFAFTSTGCPLPRTLNTHTNTHS